MRIVSPLLKAVVYPALSSIGAFRLDSDEGLSIVSYHRVTSPGYESIDAPFEGILITAETLRNQTRLLKKHYNVVSGLGRQLQNSIQKCFRNPVRDPEEIPRKTDQRSFAI